MSLDDFAEDPELARTPEGKAWEEKQAERAERLRAAAASTAKASGETFERAHAMADVIPFGQPILVGHYSEKGDRRYRARIERTYEKASELSDRAKVLDAKADNLENPYAIRSDDPDAVVKLKEKVRDLEAERVTVKAQSPEDYRAAHPNAYYGPGFDPAHHRKLDLESLGRRIRDAKARVDEIKTTRAIEPVDKEINGVRLQVDQTDNRVRLIFPSKPSEEVRAKLKSYGFHWSPFNTAWQRQLSNSALYWAEEVLKGLSKQEAPA